jgi:hypothetical protein
MLASDSPIAPAMEVQAEAVEGAVESVDQEVLVE